MVRANITRRKIPGSLGAAAGQPVGWVELLRNPSPWGGTDYLLLLVRLRSAE